MATRGDVRRRLVVAAILVATLVGWTAAAAAFDGPWFETIDELERRAEDRALDQQEVATQAFEMDELLGASLTDADTARRATQEIRRDVAVEVARWDRARRSIERAAWVDSPSESRAADRALRASGLPASEPWRRKVWLLADVDDGVEQASGLLVRRGALEIRKAHLGAEGDVAKAEREWVVARAGGDAEVDAEFDEMIEILDRRLQDLESRSTSVDFHRRKGALVPPVRSEPDHPFGPRQREDSFTEIRHTGLTYFVDVGTEIRSVGAGLVVATRRFPGFGKMVIIDHDGDYHSLYAHLESFEVSEGDEVANRQVIGLSGESGSLEGPKFYFEMRHRGVPFDPAEWFVR